MAAAPNPFNYYIGKGILSFKADGAADFVDCGNVPTFEFTPKLTQLDHFSSRAGVKTKDRTVVTEKTGDIKMVMEEFNAINMAMALLGVVGSDSAGREVIDIFSSNAISGQLKFTGTNDVGPRWELLFLDVDFIPGASISFIGDGWGTLEIAGTVNAVGSSFGTATRLGDEADSA